VLLSRSQKFIFVVSSDVQDALDKQSEAHAEQVLYLSCGPTPSQDCEEQRVRQTMSELKHDAQRGVLSVAGSDGQAELECAEAECVGYCHYGCVVAARR
jgi:hypothetical protein